MKRLEVLGCLAMLALLSACAAPAQRPEKVESVLDVVNRAEAAEPSGSKQCPGGWVPVCVSAFRHERPVCSCGDPFTIGHAFDYQH
jgi:hypothetical protein